MAVVAALALGVAGCQPGTPASRAASTPTPTPLRTDITQPGKNLPVVTCAGNDKADADVSLTVSPARTQDLPGGSIRLDQVRVGQDKRPVATITLTEGTLERTQDLANNDRVTVGGTAYRVVTVCDYAYVTQPPEHAAIGLLRLKRA